MDLSVKVEWLGGTTTVDAFEHGPESATLASPGQYRITIQPSDPHSNASVTAHLGLRDLPWAMARSRSEAEQRSSAARRSRKEEDFRAASQLWKAVGDASATGRAYLELGDTAYARADWQEALTVYQAALASCHAARDRRCIAEAANNAGSAALQAGEIGIARDRLDEAATAWRALGERHFERVTLSNLGGLFWQTGDYQGAIERFDRARVLGGPNDNGTVFNNLGACYEALEEHSTAQRYFELAIHQFSRGGKTASVTHARLNVGRVLLRTGRIGQARSLLEKALGEADAGKDEQARASALNLLGQADLKQHKLAEAEQKLTEALRLHRQQGDRRMEATALHHLGEAAAERGDTATARERLHQALDLRLRCRLNDVATDTLFALAVLEMNAGQAQAARNAAASALELMESVRKRVPSATLRAAYYARQRHFFDLLVELAADSGQADAAEAGLLASEQGRGRALLDMLVEVPATSPASARLLTRRTELRRRITWLTARLSRAPAAKEGELRRQVDLLVAEDHEIEAGLREQAVAANWGRPLSSIAELQKRLLPPDSALVEYYLGERRSYLWLVNSGRTRVFTLPGRAAVEAQCEAVARLLPDVLGRKRDPSLQSAFDLALGRLSSTLLGPLSRERLPRQVVIVPDRALHRVPFAALWIVKGRRLGIEHDLVQVPSAVYLADGRTARRMSDFSKTMLAVTDSVFSADDPRVGSTAPSASPVWSRLPFSQDIEEAVRYVGARRTKVLRGFDAVPAALRQMKSGDYAILHLSTHVVIDNRIPELSRIVLTQVDRHGRPVVGILRPDDLTAWRLNGATVVLSACDSALGRQLTGEGLLGFTSALFQAGAAQLVMSLSPVDAEASAEFFRVVYRNMLGPRQMPLSRALLEARRALAGSQRWSDPYYWASFILCGRPARSV